VAIEQLPASNRQLVRDSGHEETKLVMSSSL
jgi:hypothetical protein